MAENLYSRVRFENNLNDELPNLTWTGTNVTYSNTTFYEGSYSWIVDPSGTATRIISNEQPRRTYVQELELQFWPYVIGDGHDSGDGHLLYLQAWSNVNMAIQSTTNYNNKPAFRLIVGYHGWYPFIYLTEHTWNKITVTFDYNNSYTKVYVNDVLQATYDYVPTDPTYYIIVGGDGTNTTANASGFIDDLRVSYFTTDTMSFKGIHRTNKLRLGG